MDRGDAPCFGWSKAGARWAKRGPEKARCWWTRSLGKLQRIFWCDLPSSRKEAAMRLPFLHSWMLIIGSWKRKVPRCCKALFHRTAKSLAISYIRTYDWIYNSSCSSSQPRRLRSMALWQWVLELSLSTKHKIFAGKSLLTVP